MERELSRVSTDPQTAVFPEARQYLRSHNKTTSKKAVRPAAQAASKKPANLRKPIKEAEPDLTRYFIASHDPAETEPGLMAQKIRAHWCCESRHWQRDALWREDTCLFRNANAACALALLRVSLQTLLCLAGRTSLPAVFEDVAHDLSLGLGWLKSRNLGG